MKIEIDTQRDSKEELKKLAQFLHQLGDGAPIATNSSTVANIFDQGNNDSSGGGLLGLFGNDDAPSTSTGSTTGTGLTTTTTKGEDDEDTTEDDTKVEFY